MSLVITPSSLHPGDIFRVGAVGLLNRKLRATLSALGIAIGIAAMVSVLGISESSRADLIRSLDRLGTNVLRVEAGSGITGGTAQLPDTSETMLRRIGPIQRLATATAVDSTARRTDLVPSSRTEGLTVKAVDVGLVDTLAASLDRGRWLDPVSSELPVAVLGSVAATRLGLAGLSGDTRVRLKDQWVSVIGILRPVELAPDIDRAVLIGRSFAQQEMGTSSAPSIVYLRAEPESIDDVRSVVSATANPANPDRVEVSRPSDALAARAAANSAFTQLFIGLGAVALLVGGVGIANVMVISVLERRCEIGLRRALGATRRHISLQFLAESTLLSALGGLTGAVLGCLITAGYSLSRGWPIAISGNSILGAVLAAISIGAIAGLYPAVRAARLSPTEALRTV